MEPDPRQPAHGLVAHDTPLDNLRKEARKFLAAKPAFHKAICKAHLDGMSLREIAKETGMSHESVRKIVSAYSRGVS